MTTARLPGSGRPRQTLQSPPFRADLVSNRAGSLQYAHRRKVLPTYYEIKKHIFSERSQARKH
jgi:hypothetical protein